jgi:enoyl-CoA hydratase/carnithine racemase
METEAAANEVLREVKERVLWLTLNRPDRRNPLGPRTIGELLQAVEWARGADEVGAIVITGAGKVFSAGGDLSAMARPSGGDAITGTLVDLFVAMGSCGKPIVAMVNGHALAGGCGLVAACDLAIASDEAEFGTPEVNVGLWPMVISAAILRSVPRKRAVEMMLTGERIKAAEAAAIGLVNRAVPRASLEDEVKALCAKLTAKSPRVVALGMTALGAAEDVPFAARLKLLQERFLELLATDDAREGLAAFLEKRQPAWPSLQPSSKGR